MPHRRRRTDRALHVAIDVVGAVWELAIADGPGSAVSWKAIDARDVSALAAALARARAELELPDTAPVYTCCQRTHHGVILDRMLRCWGVQSHLVTGDLEADGEGAAAREMLALLLDHRTETERRERARPIATVPLRPVRRDRPRTDDQR